MRQPDIEIYLKDADHKTIGPWLSSVFGPCSPWRQQGKTYKCTAGEIAVIWLPKAVGSWHSLLLDSDATPWEDDLSCAQAACAALNVEVRCAPGSWDEEQSEEDDDRWLRVTPEGVSEIVWHTS